MGIQGNSRTNKATGINKAAATASVMATPDDTKIDVNAINLNELDDITHFINVSAKVGTAKEIPHLSPSDGALFFGVLANKKNFLAELKLTPSEVEEFTNNFQNYDLLKGTLGFSKKTLRALEKDDPSKADVDLDAYKVILDKYRDVRKDFGNSVYRQSQDLDEGRVVSGDEYKNLLEDYVDREKDLLRNSFHVGTFPTDDELKDRASKALGGIRKDDGNVFIPPKQPPVATWSDFSELTDK